MLEFTVTLDEDQQGVASASPLDTERRRSSRPAIGRSLGAAVTAIEAPIRDAVASIFESIDVSPAAGIALLGSTRYALGAQVESPAIRVSWAVVSIALLYARALNAGRTSSFDDALFWFSRDRGFVKTVLNCGSPRVWKTAEAELAKLSVDDGLWDLLPYVLEPHGHVTRTRLETCDVSRATRTAKKSSGVFYTPSDVAEFLVKAAAAPSGVVGTWLDPACGTGVFLRAVLACARADAASGAFHPLEFIRRNVFGVDLSSLSTDLTCFVLLAECALRASASVAPIDAWRAVRSNVVCGDALRIVPLGGGRQSQIDSPEQIHLGTLFGASVAHGFDHVIMNPPYATVPFGADVANSWSSFTAKGSSGVADAQTAFTEMLWKFTHAGGAGVAVLPLSIGTNTSTAYRALREELATVKAGKDFLFFDREPQALFGEDIKTRNLILIVRKAPGNGCIVRTSRMLKWTAKQRPTIFNEDRLVSLSGLSIGGFVPKLGSSVERDVYQHLCSLTAGHVASQSAPIFTRATISEVLDARTAQSDHDVLVSSTAYNFLNVFLVDGLPKKANYPFSSSPLNRISFADHEMAMAAIAIIFSRLSFWLWHVEGDGFHVTTEFIKRLPLWRSLVNKPVRARLAEFGSLYWASAKKQRVDSVNGGKQTSSFHTGYRHPLYGEVDALLLDALGSPMKAPSFLDLFIEATVSVDGTQRDRGLHQYKD